MFKNAQIYRLPIHWGITREALEAQLASRPFQPCGSQDIESRGWVSPKGDETLVAQAGGNWMVALCTESRLLPAAVVKEVAAERAVELESQQGYKVGRKQLRELREQVTLELLPQAFTRKRLSRALIDPKAGWLVVDAPSQARAEEVLETLRHTLDDFPLSLLRTQLSPTSAMAAWLAAGAGPDGFILEQDFKLQSVAEDRAVATYKRHDLETAHVREHLEAGHLPTRLALTYQDRLSFILTDKLELKGLEFLDGATEDLDQLDHNDASAVFDAELTLLAGELGDLIPALVEALGGEIPGDPAGDTETGLG